MRSLLLALIPGMAASALASQDNPLPAEVVYGYAGQMKGRAWQVGTECYVPIPEAAAWGWNITLSRYDAKIDAEGRTVRVPYRVQGGREVLPLSQIVKQLGATSGWRVGTRVYEVWSIPQSIKVNASGIKVAAPFPVKAQTTYQADPPRATVDLFGARLESFTEIEMPASARISQLDPNTVRIVLDTDRRIGDDSDYQKPLRNFDLELGPDPAPVSEMKDPASGTTPPSGSQNPVLIEPPTSLAETQIPLGSRLKAVAGPVAVLQDGQTAATVSVPLSLPLTGAPKISRPLPNVLRLVLPGAKYAEVPPGTAYEGTIEQVAFEQFDHAVAVEITLARPMGVELSYLDQEVRLILIKPEVGDGKLAGKTIVVDAGHGGQDSGARSPDKKTREKDLTLKIATKLASALALEGATVIMTRKSDVLIPLKERSEIANRNDADFFISCHINSNERTNSSSGTITFYHANEGPSILLAESIQAELKKGAKLPSMGVWSDYKIYDTGFAVLRYAKMPAVLLELGFINNRNDRARMTAESFPADVARSVIRGLKVYLGDVKN